MLKHAQRLGQDLADGHARVERAERVLEDGADLLPRLAQLAVGHVRQVEPPPVAGEIADLPARDPIETLQAAAHGGLARAALPDDAEVLALVQVDRDLVHSHLVAEGLRQVPRDEDRLADRAQVAGLETAARRAVQPVDRGQESASIRVARGAEHRLDVALLDQGAIAHNRNAVGDLRHHAHVVGDEEHRGAPLVLQLAD